MTRPFPARLADGDVRGTFVTVGHPVVAEVVARLGFDTIVVDLEHAAMTIETAESLVRAVESTGEPVAVVVRVPEGSDAWIKHALDTGADGVLVPKVNSGTEAREVAAAAAYPPEGRRGVAGSRANAYGDRFEEYVTTANEETAVVVQVETVAGVESATDIAAVDGVDSLFVGPADLASSLAGVGGDPGERFDEAVDRVLAAGRAENCPVGTYVGEADAIAARLETGYDYVVAGTERDAIRAGAKPYLDAYDDAYE